jgi:hypothetical protein
LFGYFIGLSVLRPGMAVLLIPLGWLSAAVLHGAWDATNDLVSSNLINVPVHVVIGVLSYALLAGAIFKARDISPSFAARCPQALPQGIGPDIDLAPASMPRPQTDGVSREMNKALEEAARDDRRSVAGLVEKVLADWLTEKGYLKGR